MTTARLIWVRCSSDSLLSIDQYRALESNQATPRRLQAMYEVAEPCNPEGRVVDDHPGLECPGLSSTMVRPVPEVYQPYPSKSILIVTITS